MESSNLLVVMPVMNLWKQYTVPCIRSLAKYDFLLIDNASVDETVTEAPKAVKYYKRNEQNIGCGRSWNYGINFGRRFGYKYIFVINNDTLFAEDTVEELVGRMERGGVIMVTAHNVGNGSELVKPDVISETEHPDFSAFLIKSDFFDIVGEFDEGFYPAYFEDNDMHYRILLAGEKAIAYDPAVYIHYGSKTQNQKPGGVVNGSAFVKNRAYFIKKWGGPPGRETFKHPFNDPTKSLKWTLQFEEYI